MADAMGGLLSRRPRAPIASSALALFVLAAVAMMIVPLPAALLDVLIVLNLAIAVAVLLTAAYAREAIELSSFPLLLVLTTLFRLALNVSSVRLILLQADAGRVIHAFGAFVVRGDYLVGGAVFLVLAIVQYLVIARGAERVAEVAARFTLDAMPGKQLAIDGELRSGAIDLGQARAGRAALGREAQLYGALDGAMRFVKGDAIAGLLVLAVSLVGGLVLGVTRRGLSLGEAARVYTLLTVGDGLVTQLPALVLAAAAALVVTRVSSDRSETTGAALERQLSRPRVLAATAALFGVLAMVPGLPLWPFGLVSAVTAALALRARLRAAERDPAPAVLPQAPRPLEIAVERRLARAAPGLAERLRAAAQAVSDDLGIPVPAAELVSSSELAAGAYAIRLRGAPLAEGVIPDGRVLADLGPAQLPPGLEAEPAAHPRTAALASWVAERDAGRAAAAGASLLDVAGCIAEHLGATLRACAPELIGLDETQRMLDAAALEAPVLVREVVPRRIDARALAEVLRRLVAEGVPLSDFRGLLESIARAAEGDRDPAVLTERVRTGLRRHITQRHARARHLQALVLDADAEEALRGAVRATSTGPRLALEPDLAEAILTSIRREVDERQRAVLLTSTELRRHLRRLVREDHPRLPVLAYQELLDDVTVERVGTITL